MIVPDYSFVYLFIRGLFSNTASGFGCRALKDKVVSVLNLLSIMP
jgi:hypothetical protein